MKMADMMCVYVSLGNSYSWESIIALHPWRAGKVKLELKQKEW